MNFSLFAQNDKSIEVTFKDALINTLHAKHTMNMCEKSFSVYGYYPTINTVTERQREKPVRGVKWQNNSEKEKEEEKSNNPKGELI